MLKFQNTEKALNSYKEWLLSQKPYLFITLTFDHEISEPLEIKSINWYLDNLNRKLLTRHYKKLQFYLSGYATRERKFSDGPNHFHLVINENASIRENKKYKIEELHSSAVKKVKQLGKQHNIQFVDYSKGLISYVFKEIYHTDGIYLIGSNGLS